VGGFLILLVILVAVWLLFVVPARRRQRSHAGMQDTIDLGDEIITAGGLHAFVRELGEEQLQVEIAPGVIVTLDRRAVAAVAREIEVEVERDDAEGEALDEPEDEPVEPEQEGAGETGSGTSAKAG
jgi:preprotein translocase subunit YajC